MVGLKAMGEVPELVVISYEDLINKETDLSEEIARAYGPGALGVIAIRGIPGFVEKKKALLRQAHQLAHLPKESLAKLEDEKSLYNAGWSHGREKLGDKPDFAKGSFYFNPLVDLPGTIAEREKYPFSYIPNLWPTEDMPKFEPAAKALGTLMHEQVVALCVHIDKFAKKRVTNYIDNIMYNAISTTIKAKGRLLYYFPLPDEELKKGAADSWIGWHNDSGFLTSLAGDMYVNDETGEEIECPDPAAGLYVVNRDGDSVKVDIPEDCMAVQMGECCQIVTGGILQATPHCVRGAVPVPGSGIKIARISHPCFIDTAPYFTLDAPKGTSREQTCAGADYRVPPLDKRWLDDGMEFGEFLKKTFQLYYEHTTK